MENVFRKFAPLCALVMKPSGDSVEFLGTAFAVHSSGYLATAAHVVKGQGKIVISPSSDATGFQAASQKLRCIDTSVVEMDEKNDVALLKFNDPVGLKLTGELFGDSNRLIPGAAIMHLGYPFGKTGSLVLAMRSGRLAAKVENPQGVRQLYVEGVAYSGAAGGPLIDVSRGTIVGVINQQLGLVPKPSEREFEFKLPIATELTFAAPIDALLDLIPAQH